MIEEIKKLKLKKEKIEEEEEEEIQYNLIEVGTQGEMTIEVFPNKTKNIFSPFVSVKII
jgi:hypothetical protein